MREGVQRDTVLPGGYVVEALIAEGRVCNVYRARSQDGDEVAARVLREDLVADLGEWFVAAARARAALDHPVIAKVFAVGYHEGLPVEVTELLEGRTAQDLLDERQNGLDVPTAVRLVRSVAAALDHLHERTPVVLHRALLPDQVLIRASDGAVKLLGVGDADRPRIAVTRPAYLSPEDLAGITSLSPRADVFSLATLTYELFTGRPAFVGGGDVVLDIVRMGRLPKLREHRPDLSPRADAVLREAWSLSPEDRPGSAGRFASLFADAVNQQAQTLLDLPVAPTAEEPAPTPEARARASTLVGPGPVDVAARRAQREERPTALDPSPEPVAAEPTPVVRATPTPARGEATVARPPRAARAAAQRPRAFIPRPSDTIEDATRPEILVPAELRDDAPVRPIEPQVATPPPEPAPPPDEPPRQEPRPSFGRTTPGIPAPTIPQPAAPPPLWRSPIVVAGFLVAHAIVIAGIAHAIAWSQAARVPPTVIQAPAPVCAPCAACPVCPAPRAELPAAPPIVARAAAPPARPAPTPARRPTGRTQILREVPSF